MTLLFTSHTDENHRIIAERIRKERPAVYFTEYPDSEQALYDRFLSDSSMSYRDFLTLQRQNGGFATLFDLSQIDLALRDAGASIVCAESLDLLGDSIKHERQVKEKIHYLGDTVGTPIILQALKARNLRH